MEKIRTQIPAASSPSRCTMIGQRKNPTTTFAPSANQLELTFFMICSFSSLRIRMRKRSGHAAPEPLLVRPGSWSAFCVPRGREKQRLGFNRVGDGCKYTEHDVHAGGLQIEFPQAFLADDIVQRQMGGVLGRGFAEAMSYRQELI